MPDGTPSDVACQEDVSLYLAPEGTTIIAQHHEGVLEKVPSFATEFADVVLRVRMKGDRQLVLYMDDSLTDTFSGINILSGTSKTLHITKILKLEVKGKL